MKNKILSIAFLTIICFGFFSNFLFSDKLYSETEKRNLQQFPIFDLPSVFSGEYTAKIEKYLTDQFFARDKCVSAKTDIEIIFGKKEINGVYIGKDGYLFEHTQTDTAKFINNINYIRKFIDTNQSIKVSTMLIPSASQILREKMPRYSLLENLETFYTYAAKQGITLTDVQKILTEHADEYIYYRTDHHFTSLGAFYCYQQWMADKGVAVDLNDFQSEMLSDHFLGTVWAKVNLSNSVYDTINAYYKTLKHEVIYNNMEEKDSIYERKYLDGKDQYAVFFNSNNATTLVKGAGKGNLLVIKDSFGNTFSQFVVDDYETVHMIDLRFFRGSVSEYITENKIDEVLVIYGFDNFSSDDDVYRINR